MVEISDEMIEAAAKAMLGNSAVAWVKCIESERGFWRSRARAVLTAALPLIEAAVRADQAEIIAKEIEAECRDGMNTDGLSDLDAMPVHVLGLGMMRAARIARGSVPSTGEQDR